MKNAISYRSAGTGKPVLLVHGWAMQAEVWTDLLADFSGQYQLIAVDLRGHGRSRELPGPYDINTLARDLILLIADLRLHDVVLLGWSMGVSVLLTMLARPAPYAGALVLVSGNPSFIRRDDYLCGVPAVTVRRIAQRIGRDRVAGLQSFYDLMLTPAEHAKFQGTAAFARLTAADRAPSPPVLLESLDSFASEDLRPVLPHLRLPTLIIHGSHDRICAAEAARFMHAGIAGSRLLWLADTGHVPFLTQKSAVHDCLRQFLAERQ
jgi:pimeloyl-[acyl-carrier protein] methyl ester esterase